MTTEIFSITYEQLDKQVSHLYIWLGNISVTMKESLETVFSVPQCNLRLHSNGKRGKLVSTMLNGRPVLSPKRVPHIDKTATL
jgi:hypothetical protein